MPFDLSIRGNNYHLSRSAFNDHFQEHSLSLSHRLCKFESNTTSDWLRSEVVLISVVSKYRKFCKTRLKEWLVNQSKYINLKDTVHWYILIQNSISCTVRWQGTWKLVHDCGE